MTTYYVAKTGSDANTGLSTAQAFLTISVGAQAAAAGDLINVLTGNYQGSIYFTSGGAYANGTSAAPITIKSITQYAAQIRALSAPAAGSGNNAAWEIRASNWVVDGFIITGEDGYSASSTTWDIGGTEWARGFYGTGDNVVVKNCKIYTICRGDAVAGAGGAGVILDYFYGGSSCSALYNHIFDIGSPLTENQVHGIYVSHNNPRVIGNLVYDCHGGACIHGWHGANRMIVVNNTCFNAESGLIVGQGDSGAATTSASRMQQCRVFNNIMLDCTFGIREQGSLFLSNGSNLYSNNLVWNCTTAYRLSSSSTAVNKISLSPSFITYVTTGDTGNYRLSVGSAAINAGIASLSGTDAPGVDLDGAARPVSATWDLGVYEFNTGATSLSSTASVSIGPASVQFFGGHERKFFFHQR